jgi:prepilin-type N-terminal cleavage/methylation domain-containing protein
MQKPTQSIIPEKTTGREGFTLIELMISLVVLAFGILGFLFLQGRAVQGRVFAREMSRATFVAQSNMEELLSMDFDYTLLSSGTHPTSGEGGTNALGTGTLVRTDTLGNFNYYTNWVIRTVSNPNVKTIQMTVTWLNKDKNSNDPNDLNSGTPLKTLTLTTAKSK